MIRIRKLSWLFLLAGAVLSLASCSLLPETESLRIFTLPMHSGSSAAHDVELPVQLRVRSLQANRMLASSRIVVLPEGNEVSAYRGVRWTEASPVLLRDRLLEAFKDDGRLQAVYSEENRLQADVELSGVLNAFQSEYIEGQVHIRIQADLLLTDAGGRRLIAQRRFDVREQSSHKGIEEVVASFGRAGDVLSQQVVDWVLGEITVSSAP